MTEHPCPRHPSRMAAPGLQVCSSVASQAEWLGCLEQLEAALRYIDDHWGDLQDQHFAVATQSQINAVFGSRPPCNLAVIEAMDARGTTHGDEPIALVVQAWCRVVVEDRRLVPPTDTRNQARWLLRQAEWLCGQDFANEAVDELRQAARALAGIIGDSDTGAARCPADIGGGQTCGQWLTLPEGGEEVQCPRCHSRWHPMRMVAVARSTPGNVVWLGADDAARALRVDVRTVRAMGKRGDIPMRYGQYNVAGVAL